ncbi:phosphotransferase family protein [Roseomonas sp. AR75]|uniref:phosphotransferase family protein n=1 Tax=Roseomonas sp. AR75 TaxID=2562311 RepID=UPI0010C15043|nr:phosphotransferase family protein [Roseomonas sp. AR75]
MDEAALTRLRDWLAAAQGDPSLRSANARKLSGGAIQQNWALDVETIGGPQRWVLRTDSAAVLAVSLPRTAEYALLRAAWAAGVTVPEPLYLCADARVIGAPFFVMRRVEGTALGPRVVKDSALGGGREQLAQALGRELACIHRIRPPRADLGFLGDPPADAGRAAISTLRGRLDDAGTPRPVIEWGLRAAERRAPPPVPPVLVHNDFRTGNLMLDASGVTGVLDWEFAAWGDGHADLGWLCAKCWRFGNVAQEAGGLGPRAALYEGYAAESGAPVEDARVRWWELMAHLRWAVIAADQAQRHLSGEERSLELALTGHIVPELEWEILAMADAP